MSAQTLSEAVVLLRDVSSFMQMLETKTLQLANGKAPFTPSENLMMQGVADYLIAEVDKYISSEEADNLPDMYERVFSLAYDDLVTSRRALGFSAKSRHNAGLRIDSDRDITSEQYSNYIQQLAEAEGESQTQAGQDDLEYGEEFA